MSSVIDILWKRTWWSYSRDYALPYSSAYHNFNLLEGAIWIVFCLLVVIRRNRRAKSSVDRGVVVCVCVFHIWPDRFSRGLVSAVLVSLAQADKSNNPVRPAAGGHQAVLSGKQALLIGSGVVDVFQNCSAKQLFCQPQPSEMAIRRVGRICRHSEWQLDPFRVAIIR